jgi:hypothetical protein
MCVVLCMYSVLFPLLLKFVPDWPAVSVSSWVTVTSVANDMVWLSDISQLASRVGGEGEWGNRREIIYCKRAILSLSSSKILTPHPPGECVLPPNTRRAERGMGGQYFGRRER